MAGIKIHQLDSETIKVIEGGGVARVIGAISVLGGTLLAWNSFGNFLHFFCLLWVVRATNKIWPTLF